MTADDTRAELAEKVRETEELYRTTVENMPVNLVLCDPEGRVLYLNPPLAALVSGMCGRAPADVIGMVGRDVWPEPIWVPLRAAIDRAMATRERQTYELATVLPNGQPMVRQWAVVPLASPDGQIRRIMAMSHDITAQRRLVDELREADRRKSEFIAVLSHELRNPLAAIRTSLYVLEELLPRNETSGEMRRIINRQVDHLVRMVDDLLDVTRIAQAKVKLQRRRLDVRELVRETVEDNRAHLEREGVRVRVRLPRAPLHVDADGARLAQVVTNLLSNAVKFTPAGGSATVSVARDRRDDDGPGAAVLTVTDTGSGIDPALLPRLFQPFMQADRTLERVDGGLGLGLALVKGLVDLHGGEVRATSGGPGKGTEIVVRLPLAGDGAPEAAARDGGSLAEAALRVLVIEDDVDVAEALRIALGIDGHRVDIARDGREGLGKARALVPDVVLCDIGLPGMNGYEVARAFRADEALRSVFLVALSGYAQSADLERARAAGFDEHLAKPATVEKIELVLEAGAARLRR
jgi:two-component system CheB/CheR fusion protein